MRRPVWGRRRPSHSLAGTLVALALVAALALLYHWLAPARTAIGGRAEVVDGDTLRFGSTRVRLTGLDAPELEQTCKDAAGQDYDCGRAAQAFLVARVGAREVNCAPSGRDRYGRTLARCSDGGGDLGAAIVDAGWAVAEVDYAVPALGARAAGRGIWQGRFEDPANWRRDHGGAGPNLWDWIRAWFQ